MITLVKPWQIALALTAIFALYAIAGTMDYTELRGTECFEQGKVYDRSTDSCIVKS